MKRLFTYLISGIVLFSYSISSVRSQSSGIPYANKQLRDLFGNLNLPRNPKLFLYDMAMHVSDTQFFTTNCPDTLETAMWYKIYEEMYNMAYDTSLFTDPDTIYKMAHDFYRDTVPMGIMNYAFYKLKPKALSSNLYFDFDTINNKLIDKYPRPGFPYIDSNMFASAPLIEESYYSNPVFRIDPAFILYDHFNMKKYTKEGILKIDFGDGKGFVKFDPTKITHHQVNYTSAGHKPITSIIQNANSLKVVHSSNSKIVILNAQTRIAPTPYAEVPGLNVGIFKGCNSDGLKTGKLVIYLGGFDILDNIPSFSRDVSMIYSQMISSNKIVQLKNQGYTFVVVDYKNSRIDMRFNALYLVNLLEKIKCDLDMSHQFVIMGESMGGLVARYAMTYMESDYYDNQDTDPFFVEQNDPNNSVYLNANSYIFNLPDRWCLTSKKHNTRLLITLDSPHQGANIPLSIQHAYKTSINFLSRIATMNMRVFTNAFNLFIDGQAAQQMLIYHVDHKNGSNYTSAPEKDDFFKQLEDLGDYPKHAKNNCIE